MIALVKVLFCQQYGAAINILKNKRPFLITKEAIADSSSRCIQNLCKFIQALSLDVPHAYLCINHTKQLCKRYSQLTTEHFRFISDLLISDL